jgi:hypothetical protein
MNARLGIAFAVTTVVLVGVCIVQQRQLAQLRATSESAASVRSVPAADAKSAPTPFAGSPRPAPSEQKAAPLTPAVPGAGAVESPVAAAGGEGSAKGGMGDMLAKLMEDPGMRKVMRDQQRATFDNMFGALYRELNLTEEEKGKLTDLMLDNGMKGMTRARDLFGGGDASKRAEVAKTLADDQKEMQASVKDLLGEDRYVQYEDYTKNLGNRMAVDQLKARLASSATPLEDAQAQQLLQIMREEHQMGSDATGFAGGAAANDTAQTVNALMSGEGMEQMFQKQEAINQRVAERAATLLGAEQVEALRSQQASQLDLQRMGMKMARQMMGGAGEAPAGPPATAPAR